MHRWGNKRFAVKLKKNIYEQKYSVHILKSCVTISHFRHMIIIMSKRIHSNDISIEYFWERVPFWSSISDNIIFVQQL